MTFLSRASSRMASTQTSAMISRQKWKKPWCVSKHHKATARNGLKSRHEWWLSARCENFEHWYHSLGLAHRSQAHDRSLTLVTHHSSIAIVSKWLRLNMPAYGYAMVNRYFIDGAISAGRNVVSCRNYRSRHEIFYRSPSWHFMHWIDVSLVENYFLFWNVPVGHDMKHFSIYRYHCYWRTGMSNYNFILY